MEMEFNALT